MAKIVSVSEAHPPFCLSQEQSIEFAREMFQPAFMNIDRLLGAFLNGHIEKRHFAKDINWYRKRRTFAEKNNAFIEVAVELGAKAIIACLDNTDYLKKRIPYEKIDAIFTICTTGLSTPSIEARIMNLLPFSPHTKRIPIWGLGCAGGASGLARAYEYCLAFPKSMVLVLSIELCSLTFQHDDVSKSNLIGTSIFADGVACTLVVGDEAQVHGFVNHTLAPKVVAVQSTLMKNSLDVMGWDIKNEGLYVVFSKDIPSIVKQLIRPNLCKFLQNYGLEIRDIDHFIAHPGGRKVLEAYEEALSLSKDKTATALEVLKGFGNMSSATIFYVLNRILKKQSKEGEIGLATALGPGFSSELLLLRWESY